MSIECIARVLPWQLGGTPKLILLGLANHAHPDGTRAFPAVATLAEYAHCDRRTVQRALRYLEDNQWIIREQDAGAHGTTSWSIPAAPPDGGRQNAAPRQIAARGTGDARGAAPVPPEPSIEPSTTPPSPPSGGNGNGNDRRSRRETQRQRAARQGSVHEADPAQIARDWGPQTAALLTDQQEHP